MTAARMALSSRLLAALAAGALAGAGCGGAAQPAPSYTKIDDMEGTVNALQWIGPTGTVPGGWFTATDCTHFDAIAPPPYDLVPDGWSYAEIPAPHETLPGTVSTHASRLRTTSPLANTWGAQVGLAFASVAGTPPPDGGVPTDDAGHCVDPPNIYPNPPVDLTAYAGITFWARAESPGGRKLRVQVNDVNTDPRGGICQDKDTSASTYCYNAFGVQVDLTDTFRQYTLDFSTFTQRGGWGYHPADGIDWTRVFTLNFEMDLPSCVSSATSMCPGTGAPTLSFDIWIDDLYFVNK
jgi:hypothetical protein